MICSVSRFSGTSGSRNTGRLSGISPMSPTRADVEIQVIATADSTTMATSGEGTALVSSGRP
jgi:hypothetical protein